MIYLDDNHDGQVLWKTLSILGNSDLPLLEEFSLLPTDRGYRSPIVKRSKVKNVPLFQVQ